ncbi:hypothetical protein AAG570_000655 [Ranatra chinensis]|uniref:Neogenin C-terminal domain-containing protein n=1 Tax=Ranatra chinensis TaxID=642074 RepID=A0ABD0YXZ9_9HEMI
MELKNLEKSQDQVSTSTLPRDHTSTLEKQQQRDNYASTPSYMAEEKTSTARRTVKPKPITLPVDNSPYIRESVSVSGGGSLTPSSTNEARPLYPRTQYSISSRAHVTIDPNRKCFI